jgi:hypothetical protein
MVSDWRVTVARTSGVHTERSSLHRKKTPDGVAILLSAHFIRPSVLCWCVPRVALRLEGGLAGNWERFCNETESVRSARSVFSCLDEIWARWVAKGSCNWFQSVNRLTARSVVTVCITSLTFNNSTFCSLSEFMCFVWISEQTAIISLYNINWLVFVTDAICLLRGTDWGFIHKSVWSHPTGTQIPDLQPVPQSLHWIKHRLYISSSLSYACSRVSTCITSQNMVSVPNSDTLSFKNFYFGIVFT